ncbi:hypothetical protein BKA57DRAFT_478465 [Linnemannia elongata]|nr:hypothetical protein BKA57DRAFT_478465 [Linnemannia elongata]
MSIRSSSILLFVCVTLCLVLSAIGTTSAKECVACRETDFLGLCKNTQYETCGPNNSCDAGCPAGKWCCNKRL